VDIVIGDIPYVKKDPSKEKVNLPMGKKAVRKDRRKNKQDRRSNVREGIFVSFSGKDDQRALRDRRKVSS
jgi:hypothetical protein